MICTRDDEHFSTFAHRDSPFPSVFEHLPFKAVLRSIAPCKVSYSLIAEKEKENTESHKIDELYEFSNDSSRDKMF